MNDKYMVKIGNALKISGAISVLVQSSIAVGAEHLTPEQLQKKMAFYQGIGRLETRFQQKKTLKDLGVEIRSKGKLTIEKPDVVIWEVTAPAPMTVRVEKDQMTIRSGGDTVTLRKQDAPSEKIAASLRTMVAWLNMDAVKLSEVYEVSEISNQKYRFVPRNASDSPFDSLEMRLSPQGHLEKLTLRERSLDEIEIEFERPRVRKN